MGGLQKARTYALLGLHRPAKALLLKQMPHVARHHSHSRNAYVLPRRVGFTCFDSPPSLHANRTGRSPKERSKHMQHQAKQPSDAFVVKYTQAAFVVPLGWCAVAPLVALLVLCMALAPRRLIASPGTNQPLGGRARECILAQHSQTRHNLALTLTPILLMSHRRIWGECLRTCGFAAAAFCLLGWGGEASKQHRSVVAASSSST